MTWPTKNDFVDGDVLTAAQVNNIGTNLNLADPTGITDGYVLTADGAGSMGWEAAGGKIIQTVRSTLTTSVSTTTVFSNYASMATTGLSVTITPTSASNYLLVMAIGGDAYVYRNAGSTTYRSQIIAFYDTTSNVARGASVAGTTLIGASSVIDAGSNHPLGLGCMFQAPNTSARTIQLRFATAEANNTAYIDGTVSGTSVVKTITMYVQEIEL